LPLVCLLIATAYVTGEDSARASDPEFVFSDMSDRLSGYSFRHRIGATGSKELIEPFASGCGVFDYDADGDLDLYFVNGASTKNLEKVDASYLNRLYRNDGDFNFVDVTLEAGVQGTGYGMGVAAGDYDNDGFVDLYLTQFGGNQLFRNQGDGTFSDVTSEAGVAGGKWSSSAAFFDFDRDGLLDLYVGRYLEWEMGKGPPCGNPDAGWRSYCLPDPFPPVPDILYRNNGDGTFTDVTSRAGIDSVQAKALGVTVCDFDLDGWVDVFVANDRHKDYLFRNNGDGTFEEMGTIAGVSYSLDGIRRAGMGTDFGDFNQDGWPDLLVTNFADEGIALFESFAAEFFEDQAGLVGLLEPSFNYVIFGIRFFDFDCDGLLDVLAVTGHILDDIVRYREDRTHQGPTLLFRNLGEKFEEVKESESSPLKRMTVSRGAAFGDLDNDGDVDVIVNNNDSAPLVLRNEVGNRLNSLLLKLEGDKSNRDGIGTRVKVLAGDRTQTLEVKSAASYMSANDLRLHIGLGKEKSARRITLHWPSGEDQELGELEAGYLHLVSEKSGVTRSVPLHRDPSSP
jgi:hypothetical protein